MSNSPLGKKEQVPSRYSHSKCKSTDPGKNMTDWGTRCLIAKNVREM
jgi:hypothetical protein